MWPRFGPRVGRLGVHSALSLPLLVNDKAIGALNVYARPRDSFGSAATRMGEVLIAVAGASIDEADVAMDLITRPGDGDHLVLDQTALWASGRRYLEKALREAVAQGTLGVAYQPIIRLSDGLIDEVGRWVLHRACEDHVRWTAQQLHDQPGRVLALSVNVSVHQLMADDFVASTLEILQQTGVPASLLLLEITESVFIHDAERAAQVIADLRRAGIGVGLDDFGTGYSSLAYLRRFPVDLLKIDQSFVADIGADPAATVIVPSVIALASSLGLSAIAEGVQTEEQRELLAAMGCPFAQGFLFHPALPARAVAQHLARV